MKKRMKTRHHRFERLEHRNMLAAAPRPLGDVNTQPAGSVGLRGRPSEYLDVGDEVFFSAYDSAFGEELWKSDGTTDGTSRVKDISPGPAGTNLWQLTEHGGFLFFNAIIGGADVVGFGPDEGSLWMSDGTAEGTQLVDSPAVNSMVSTPSNGLVFANDNGLWKYQSGHKTLLSSGAAYGVSLVEGRVYFRTESAGLWTTDGTEGGTVRLTDFDTRVLAASDGVMYYSTYDGPLWRVWQTDGTLAGTPGDPLLELSMNPNQVEIQDKTLFLSTYDNFGTLQYWSVDTLDPVLQEIGDQEGRRILSRVEFPARPEWDFYFSRPRDSGELWRTDGTDGGTIRLSEFAQSVTAYGDRLLFADNAQQLWSTDGTIEGTVPIKEITVGEKFPRLHSTDEAVFFHGRGDDEAGMELWKSDGTIEGTVLVKDIHTGTADFDVRSFQKLEGQVVLGGTDVIEDLGLPGNWAPGVWAFDALGSQLTQLTAQIQFGSESVRLGDQVFFVGETRSRRGIGRTLWKTDGTPGGTHQVTSLDTIRRVGTLNGELIVNSDRRLYKVSDLSEQAIRLAPSRTFGAFFSNFVSVNEALVFSATDQHDNPGLWRTDGTDGGTYSIMRSEAHDLAVFEDRVFFRTYEPHKTLLWSTNGTSDGTHLVREFNSGFLKGFTPLDGFLYFRVQRGGSEGLWRTDGTTDGTERVADVRFGRGAVEDTAMIGYGDLLVFAASDEEKGEELWRTDGTAAGTWPIKDIRPGAKGSDLSGFEVVYGQVHFAANDGVHGKELWTTDGTAKGTILVSDLRPGPVGSYPASMTAIDGELFFTANDGVHGREPWRLTSNDPVPGDANNDGRVDATDLNTLGIHWQQEVFGASHGDFNDDGRVNAEDLNLLALNWRAGTGANAPVAAAPAPARRVRKRTSSRVPLKAKLDPISDSTLSNEVSDQSMDVHWQTQPHVLKRSGFSIRRRSG